MLDSKIPVYLIKDIRYVLLLTGYCNTPQQLALQNKEIHMYRKLAVAGINVPVSVRSMLKKLSNSETRDNFEAYNINKPHEEICIEQESDIPCLVKQELLIEEEDEENGKKHEEICDGQILGIPRFLKQEELIIKEDEENRNKLKEKISDENVYFLKQEPIKNEGEENRNKPREKICDENFSDSLNQEPIKKEGEENRNEPVGEIGDELFLVTPYLLEPEELIIKEDEENRKGSETTEKILPFLDYNKSDSVKNCGSEDKENTKRNINERSCESRKPSNRSNVKCDYFEFEMFYKRHLPSHLLERTVPETVTVIEFKCSDCDYQAPDKSNLEKHALTHEIPKDDKCEHPSTSKHNLESQNYMPEKPRKEATMLLCAQCNYQTKRKSNLRRHCLTHKKEEFNQCVIHKNSGGEDLYICAQCKHQSKRKGDLKSHLLTHRKPEDAVMYGCKLCKYRTRWKKNLARHRLVHKKPEEAMKFQCTHCDYQTKRKDNLKSHNLIHEKREKAVMYQCVQCEYQTKRKDYLKIHCLIHRKPGETVMHKCALCDYQTKKKDDLKSHNIIHKKHTPHKCGQCEFETKWKKNLERHCLIHKKTK